MNLNKIECANNKMFQVKFSSVPVRMTFTQDMITRQCISQDIPHHWTLNDHILHFLILLITKETAFPRMSSV